MPWACFIVESSPQAQLYLRRYSGGGPGDKDGEACPGRPGSYSFHQAMTQIHREPMLRDDEGYIKFPDVGPYANDQRWPERCEHCDYAFVEDDERQVYQAEIWLAQDGSSREFVDTSTLPPGAMLNAWWDFRATPGSDGKRWAVALPPEGGLHLWCVDGPATSGGRWQRTGVAPHLTVTPSILTDRYHGFLQNGMLTDSLPDRPL